MVFGICLQVSWKPKAVSDFEMASTVTLSFKNNLFFFLVKNKCLHSNYNQCFKGVGIFQCLWWAFIFLPSAQQNKNVPILALIIKPSPLCRLSCQLNLLQAQFWIQFHIHLEVLLLSSKFLFYHFNFGGSLLLIFFIFFFLSRVRLPFFFFFERLENGSSPLIEEGIDLANLALFPGM